MSQHTVTGEVCSIGTALAVVISWSLFHSIWWGILHGIFGWFYVIYYALGYSQ